MATRNSSKVQVLCIGSATVDTYIHTKEPYKSHSLGDKVLVTHQEHQVGGGASNVAIALKHQAISVAIAAKLGFGHNGIFIASQLQAMGIPNLVKSSSRCHTDTAFILSSQADSDRIIFVNKDASLQLSPKDLPLSLIQKQQAQWIYLSTVLGKSLQTLKRLIPQIKKSSLPQKPKLLFNPSLYLATQGSQKLRPILRHTDLLILNKEEAMALLGIKKVGRSLRALQEILETIRSFGPKLVIITNGPKTLHASDGIFHYTLSPPTVKVIHSAGAGDAFNAAVLAALCQGKDFPTSLRCGQANASSVLSKLGTTKGLLRKRQVSIINKKLSLEVKTYRIR